jgi:hypothetical protein
MLKGKARGKEMGDGVSFVFQVGGDPAVAEHGRTSSDRRDQEQLQCHSSAGTSR